MLERGEKILNCNDVRCFQQENHSLYTVNESHVIIARCLVTVINDFRHLYVMSYLLRVSTVRELFCRGINKTVSPWWWRRQAPPLARDCCIVTKQWRPLPNAS